MIYFKLNDVIENEDIKDYYMCNKEGEVFGKRGKRWVKTYIKNI